MKSFKAAVLGLTALAFVAGPALAQTAAKVPAAATAKAAKASKAKAALKRAGAEKGRVNAQVGEFRWESLMVVTGVVAVVAGAVALEGDDSAPSSP
jgi:hypothetical protein